MRSIFPFSAIVGQDDLKLALVLAAIDPTIGGVLITGDRGTAKSTIARGIAALLPSTSAGSPAPFIELPLGATEDRVVGSLDISKVLRDGRAELRSGVLARAHGGVLYVDEVNLLPDHIVDLLLDAAASGWVTVERDGVSTRQAAEFVLVGTMNPEEGELRPQFLDRFGLCVHVRALDTHDSRVEAIRQRLRFDDNPTIELEAARPAEHALRAAILAARERLGRFAITDAHLSAVAVQAIDGGLAGIRGDLAVIKAARALAAWEAALEISNEHIRRVAAFALNHRTRRKKWGEPRASSIAESSAQSRPETEVRVPALMSGAPPTGDPLLRPAAAVPLANDIRLATGAMDHDRAGRRDAQAFAARRVIGTVPFQQTGTLAITETLTAAIRRGARAGEQGMALAVADLRQHERQGSGASHVLFLVDASGSMATQRRLSMAKGAASALLAASSQCRDQVALMVFRGEGTDLILPFTRHTGAIEQALVDVPTGGRTPLARALLDAAQLLRSRESALLVVLTDGRANVAVDGGDPWDEALAACESVRAASAGALVIDCEPGPITLGRARVLAERLDAECVALDTVDTAGLTLRIHRRREML